MSGLRKLPDTNGQIQVARPSIQGAIQMNARTVILVSLTLFASTGIAGADWVICQPDVAGSACHIRANACPDGEQKRGFHWDSVAQACNQGMQDPDPRDRCPGRPIECGNSNYSPRGGLFH